MTCGSSANATHADHPDYVRIVEPADTDKTVVYVERETGTVRLTTPLLPLGTGGCLCDAPGMGKTITVIAFLLWNVGAVPKRLLDRHQQKIDPAECAMVSCLLLRRLGQSLLLRRLCFFFFLLSFYFPTLYLLCHCTDTARSLLVGVVRPPPLSGVLGNSHGLQPVRGRPQARQRFERCYSYSNPVRCLCRNTCCLSMPHCIVCGGISTPQKRCVLPYKYRTILRTLF